MAGGTPPGNGWAPTAWWCVPPHRRAPVHRRVPTPAPGAAAGSRCAGRPARRSKFDALRVAAGHAGRLVAGDGRGRRARPASACRAPQRVRRIPCSRRASGALVLLRDGAGRPWRFGPPDDVTEVDQAAVAEWLARLAATSITAPAQTRPAPSWSATSPTTGSPSGARIPPTTCWRRSRCVFVHARCWTSPTSTFARSSAWAAGVTFDLHSTDGETWTTPQQHRAVDRRPPSTAWSRALGNLRAESFPRLGPRPRRRSRWTWRSSRPVRRLPCGTASSCWTAASRAPMTSSRSRSPPHPATSYGSIPRQNARDRAAGTAWLPLRALLLTLAGLLGVDAGAADLLGRLALELDLLRVGRKHRVSFGDHLAGRVLSFLWMMRPSDAANPPIELIANVPVTMYLRRPPWPPAPSACRCSSP